MDDAILSEFQVDISEDHLSTLKAEERERVTLRDTKLAILNSNQFHWKAQNIWSRHLSLKHPSNEPQYSVKARLFLSRVNATPWEEQSCPALQFISDCFRQLPLEDKHMVKTTPQFCKLIHMLAPHVEREHQKRDQLLDGMLVQARLLEPGPLKVYHDPSIKKVPSSSSSRSNVRQTRVDDGDDLDISMASNSASHSTGATQPEAAMDFTGGGSSSQSPTQSTFFPAMGSVFGDTAGADKHGFFDGDESDGLAPPRGFQSLGVPGPASVHYTQDFGVPGPASVQSCSTPDDEDARRRAHRARVDADSRAHREARAAEEFPPGCSRAVPTTPFTIPSATPRGLDTRPPGVMIVAFASLMVASKTCTFAVEPLLDHITPVRARLADNCVAIFFDPSSIAFAAKDVDNIRTTNLIEHQLFLVQGNSLLQITGPPRSDPVSISILVGRQGILFSELNARTRVCGVVGTVRLLTCSVPGRPSSTSEARSVCPHLRHGLD